MKRFLILVCTSALCVGSIVRAADAPAPTAVSDTSKQMLKLTASQLAAYNGLNGAKAYIAIDSIIYDETGVDAWKSGKHGGMSAGTDITAKISSWCRCSQETAYCWKAYS